VSPAPPPTDEHPLWRYRVALLVAGLLWSTGGLFIKHLSVHPAWHAGALGITCYRSLFACLSLLPFLRGRALPKPADALTATVLYTLLLGLYVAATQGTTAANAIFLQYTAPLWALVFGPWLFKEPFQRADAAALAAAMVGIGVLFVGNFQGGEQLALMLGAGSGAMFGFYLLWLRRMRYADPLAVTAVNNGGVALVSGLALLALRPEEALLIPRSVVDPSLLPVVLLLASMGALQIAIPYVLLGMALKRLSAVESSLISLVEPVLNPVWVMLFFGEVPSAATIWGAAIILAALGARYTLFRPRAQAGSPSP
jgi:drug/metabolite transporter, DME family